MERKALNSEISMGLLSRLRIFGYKNYMLPPKYIAEPNRRTVYSIQLKKNVVSYFWESIEHNFDHVILLYKKRNSYINIMLPSFFNLFLLKKLLIY